MPYTLHTTYQRRIEKVSFPIKFHTSINMMRFFQGERVGSREVYQKDKAEKENLIFDLAV